MTTDVGCSTSHVDGLLHAERTALEWIDTVAGLTGVTDREHAYRILRTWLHTVRDRLTVDGAAHVAAQLPLILRGVWYEGWRPSSVPVKYGPDHLVSAMRRSAQLREPAARRTVARITAALDQLWSPGQTEHLLVQFPGPLRELLAPDRPVSDDPEQVDEVIIPRETSTSQQLTTDPFNRLNDIEAKIAGVVDTLRALLESLESRPADGTGNNRATEATHRAHRLLLDLGETR